MKKCKFIYKFKKILISIMCIITLFFAMPIKASAGPIESLADMVLWIFDLPMRALNAVVAESDSASYIDVNLKGWDMNLGTRGMLYNFEVTPDRIFSAGKTEEVFVPDDTNEEENGKNESVDSKTQLAGVYRWIISDANTQQNDPIYSVKVRFIRT